jgi:hypothetical protein
MKSENRTKFLSFIMLGVLGTFFILMFIAPIISINMVKNAGKGLASVSQTVISTACGESGKVVKLAGDVVVLIGGGTLDTIVNFGGKVMEAVKFVGELISKIQKLTGPVQSTMMSSVEGIMTLVNLASNGLTNTIGKVTGLLNSGLGEVLNLMSGLSSDIGELLGNMVSKVITPAMKGLKLVKDELADRIEMFTKNGLSDLLGAINILQSVGQSTTFSDISTAMLSLTVGLYVKVASNIVGVFTNSNIVGDLIDGVVTILGEIGIDLSEISFDFCEQITSIVNLALSRLPNLPGPADLNRCRTPFIHMGIYWMTGGLMCSKENPPLAMSECLLGDIGDVVFLPAFEITVSARRLANAIGFDFPSIPSPFGAIINIFKDMIYSLPGLTFGWDDISINTILANVNQVYRDLFETLKSFIGPSLSGVKATFSGAPMGLSILGVLLKIITQFIIYFFEKVKTFVLNALNTAVNILTWNECVNLCFPCFDPCFGAFGGCEICPGCFGSLCVDDVLPGMSTIRNFLKDIIRGAFDYLLNLTAFVNRLLGSFADFSITSELKAIIDDAFSNLSFGPLPIYFGLD